jgi:hypothetical protein
VSMSICGVLILVAPFSLLLLMLITWFWDNCQEPLFVQ